MSQHTPGPWYESSTGNHQGLVISETTGRNVAVTYDKADARMIAQAPAMREALQRLHDAIDRLPAVALSDEVEGLMTEAEIILCAIDSPPKAGPTPLSAAKPHTEAP